VAVDQLRSRRAVVPGQQSNALYGNTVRGKNRHERVSHLPGIQSCPSPAFFVIARNARITLFGLKGVPTLDAKTGP
jgi:hypothetical protein